MANEKQFLTEEERVMLALRGLYRRAGYSAFRMSRFEEYELYLRNKEFLIGDSAITFTDADGRLLALKPDVTLSIVKNFRDGDGVSKYCYDERVYRYVRDKHSYTELLQSGVEYLGDVDDVAVAEVVMLALQSLRLMSESSVLELSHMGLLREYMASLSLSLDVSQRLLHAIGEKNRHELREIARGAALSSKEVEVLLALSSLRGGKAEVFQAIKELSLPKGVLDCAAELEALCRILDEGGAGNYILDCSLVSDARYYNGIIFRGFVAGIPERVLSGGRYDLLMQRMQKTGGAIGFAVYLDALERMGEDCSQEVSYDADVFLLYDEKDAPALVCRELAAERVRTDGVVLAGKKVPTDMRVKEIKTFSCGEGI